MKAIFAVINTTWAVVKIRPEKNSGLYGIWTHDHCDTSAVLYQLSSQANWELVIMLVPYKPVKWWINDCEYMKIVYVDKENKNWACLSFLLLKYTYMYM